MIAPSRVLEVQNLSLAYGRHLAVESASFHLDAAECVCMVGRNGSGKSTLFKGILGLVPPRSGNVLLHVGHGGVAFVPQMHPGEEDFPASAWEVVIAGCQGRNGFFPLYSERDRQAARRSLEAMGVMELAGRGIGELSGGQRRRVLLARALCRDPSLLLMDEPCAGLDQDSAGQLLRIVDDLRRERNMAVLMSSHDLEAVSMSASRVIVMDRRIAFDGPVATWVDHLGKGGI